MNRGFQSTLFSQNEDALSVSDVTSLVKALIESEEQLQDVRIQGEVSNLSRPASGHIYFTLKDSKSQIKCAMWKSSAIRMRSVPRDGEAVIARGRVGVYEAIGAYQFYVESMTSVGAGDLNAEFERLKLKLQAEGLFDAERKRELPIAPRVLGVVTSASAAAFQDILNVLSRRYPVVEVVLSPTQVQGDDAPPQIVRAIQRLQGQCDVILVARGGGSMEDLWAFNDERVVRAIAASDVPVVSGVGHEIDFTLTDFAADVRAPTPSAAAEMITPDIVDLRQRADAYGAVIEQLVLTRLSDARSSLAELQRALRLLSPSQQVAQMRQSAEQLRQRLQAALAQRAAIERALLNGLSGRLAALGPEATLARGYAIVRRADGQVVRSTTDSAPGAALRVRVNDGEFGVIRDPSS